MIKTLRELSIKSFFTCKKTELNCSYYCLFSYIYILMNKREIYFLCDNTADYICFNYPKEKFCKHCKRLQKFNSLFEKIENEKKTKTFKLIHLVNEITDHILKYNKYYILSELSNKQCDLNHFLH